MPRCKPVDRSPKYFPVVQADQLQPDTFEFTLDYLVDHELDLSRLDAKFNNDVTGASAYDPRMMLKVVLLAAQQKGRRQAKKKEPASSFTTQIK
jgi:transposase